MVKSRISNGWKSWYDYAIIIMHNHTRRQHKITNEKIHKILIYSAHLFPCLIMRYFMNYVFQIVFSLITKLCKQFRCHLAQLIINKWYKSHIMEYCTAVKKNELLPQLEWMNLNNIQFSSFQSRNRV